MMFTGEVEASWTIGGADQLMRLDKTIHFYDSKSRKWTAPEGLIFDGASIPRPLWPVVGSPFTGPYRRAAVFHDAAYQARVSTRREADWMLYEAMRCDQTPLRLAWTIWAGVRLFGWLPWRHKGEIHEQAE